MMTVKWSSIRVGVIVKANQKFTYGTWMEFNEGGKVWEGGSVVDNDMFKVEDSEHIKSNNSSDRTNGVIPGLIYRLL